MRTNSTDDATKCISNAYITFYKGIEEAAGIFEGVVDKLTDNEFLKQKPATVFILKWMREYFLQQKKFDLLIQRQVMPSSADLFTGAVAITLKHYLAAKGYSKAVKSEYKIKPLNLRPDVTVWNNNGILVAAIEFKTNLGYQRSGWEKQQLDRESSIQQHFPKCTSYLCVLTKKNWENNFAAFTNNARHQSKQWLCLANIWPSEICQNDCTKNILHPVEPMFIQICSHLRAEIT